MGLERVDDDHEIQSRMSSILANYQPQPGIYDELMTADGEVRPQWQGFIDDLKAMSQSDLDARWGKVERLLYENGITFNAHAEADQAERRWDLDSVPLLIAEDEWTRLAAGLCQRARLLNGVLADLYGEQSLIRNGVIPASLIFASPHFLRPCHGIAQRQGVFLNYYAADLARGPDGSWCVIKDLCEAPEGTGFALENRIVLSHCFPELFRENRVHRLARFFQSMHEGLVALTPREDPRIVMITPGPMHDSHFANAYLARYLGYTLAEGADLTVRDARVFLKTLDGLQPVDLIMRRIMSNDCDPLELNGGSLLGVPGLLEAVRAGNVVVANSIGAGLAGGELLLPFLSGACRHLLGEDLALPSAATWWCGTEDARSHVLANLENFVIKPAIKQRQLGRQLGAPRPAAGKQNKLLVAAEMSAAERAELAARIAARGLDFMAQEPVVLSTAPERVGESLRPTPTTFRAYVAFTSEGYIAMPGGLARSSASNDPRAVALDGGAGVKDTWILANEPLAPHVRSRGRLQAVPLRRIGKDLPSRAADNLFWLGRYSERAEDIMRLLRSVIVRLTEDGRPVDDLDAIRKVMLPIVSKADLAPETAAEVTAGPSTVVWRHLRSLMCDANCPYGLAPTLANLRRTALLARDRLSVDAWKILSGLKPEEFLSAGDGGLLAVNGRAGEVIDLLDDGIRSLAAFSGMEMENMTRNHGWRFLDMGRRTERGSHATEALLGLLGSGAADDDGRLVLLLELADSFMTYRSRYLTTPQLAPVLDLLLLDDSNPRAIAFQLQAIAEHIEQLPHDADNPALRPEQRIMLSMQTALRLSDIEALASLSDDGDRIALSGLLEGILEGLEQLSSTLTRNYFSHAEQVTSLRSASLAAEVQR